MQTENKLNITVGEWAYAPTGEVMQGYSQPFAIAELGKANLIAGVFGDVKGGYTIAMGNAALIADAGTTANKCGLLPSELLKQRDELRKALEYVLRKQTRYGGVTLHPEGKVITKIKAALQSIKQQ